MTLIERFENERKSLVYHLESLQSKIIMDPNDELAKEQVKKLEGYINAIDVKIKEISN